MSVANSQPLNPSLDRKEKKGKIGRRYRVAIALLSPLPLSVGMKLRKWFYPGIFARMGDNVQIEPNVEFNQTYWIEIGEGTYIRSIASIAADGKNSWIKIGDRVSLERGVDIRAHDDGYIEIGDRTRIGPYTCLSGRHIKIGQDCLIASHSGIYANNHIFTDPDRKINQQERSYKGITIEDDCWLGSGVRITDGVTIGRGSVIGAGAVVTKDIPPYSVAVGVPAKVVSLRKKTPENSPETP